SDDRNPGERSRILEEEATQDGSEAQESRKKRLIRPRRKSLQASKKRERHTDFVGQRICNRLLTSVIDVRNQSPCVFFDMGAVAFHGFDTKMLFRYFTGALPTPN